MLAGTRHRNQRTFDPRRVAVKPEGAQKEVVEPLEQPAGNLSCPLRKGLNGISLRTLRLIVVSAVLALAVGVPASASAQTGTPTACFTVTPSSPKTGDVVSFNSSCSTNV